MPRLRSATLTSCFLFAACGGKVIVGGNETAGTTGGMTTGDVVTTTGTSDPGPPRTDPGPSGGGAFGTGGAPGMGGDDCSANGCPVGMDASAGSGAAGGSVDPPVDIDVASLKSNLGFQWRSSWFITGCQIKSLHNCMTPGCGNQTAPDFEDRGAVVKEIFPLGGQAGSTYAVTFNFNGVSEGKYYQGGVRAAGEAIPDNIDNALLDTFYMGGTAVPGSYNVLRMRILDPDMKEVARYYMNSFPQRSGGESHRTFLLSYTKTIDVPGRGFVEHLVQDSNCHAIDNCGPGEVMGDTCNAARHIPNEANAALPPFYLDPLLQKIVPLASLNAQGNTKQPWHAQIGHLTITSVVRK